MLDWGGWAGERAAKSERAMTPHGLEKLFNIAEIDTTGPVSSTPAPLSPLPTKLQAFISWMGVKG